MALAELHDRTSLRFVLLHTLSPNVEKRILTERKENPERMPGVLSAIFRLFQRCSCKRFDLSPTIELNDNLAREPRGS